MSYYSHPYPVIASEKMMQRAEGDGMDSEVLRLQDLRSTSSRPTRAQQQAKPRKLNTPERTMTVNKPSAATFIPHEPVKGAVKPVFTLNSSVLQKSQPSLLNLSADLPKTKASLNSKENLFEYKISPKKSGSKQQSMADHDVDKGKAQRPMTLDTLRRTEEVKVNMVASPVELEANVVALDEVRSVEGQVDNDSDTRQLQKQIEEMQSKLDVQTKVNEDLKKLLVASMGDDLHYKMEAIVRTKAHLAMEVGDYTQKMYQDYENLDKLSIQADMWRSKYMALRVMADELSCVKTDLTERCHQYQHAVGTLIQEMQQILEFNSHTYRYLYQLQDALGMRTRRMGIGRPDNPLNLANINMQLADSVRFTLIGSIPAAPPPVDTSATNFRTPGENMAMQVLSSPIPDVVKKPPGSILPSPALEKYSRFHPTTRYENITFNCCPQCSGELQVV